MLQIRRGDPDNVLENTRARHDMLFFTKWQSRRRQPKKHPGFSGVEVLVESGAGESSYYPDSSYTSATIVPSAAELYSQADLVVKIQPPTEAEIGQMKAGATVAGMMLPHRFPERVKLLRDRKLLSFAMELVPRISRAQSMDVLSSQAAVAGYKAALMAADRSGGFFPMLTTAAGTIRPAKVLA